MPPVDDRYFDDAVEPMSTLTVSRNQIFKRRSSRMALNAKISVSGQDRQKSSLMMPAKASNTNIIILVWLSSRPRNPLQWVEGWQGIRERTRAQSIENIREIWWRRLDSNQRPTDYES
jgi:hypothetical protein